MRLEVTCQDRVGLAKDILEVLEQHKINLKGIDASSLGYLYMQFADLNFDTLSELLPRIRKIQGVLDVRTTPFMPSEREHYALKTLLKTLPDGVFAIDAKGRISIVNDSALKILDMQEEEVLDESLNHWVQGFSFGRWLSLEEVTAQATRVSVGNKEYLVEALPVYLPNEEGDSILAGAVVAMKTPQRVGEQFSALQNQVAGFEKIKANSKAMKAVVKQVRKLAQLDAPLLLSGEIGSGKEIIAQALHEVSLRKEKAFITLSCASLSGSSEVKALFGEVDAKGLWHAGALQQANGGTLLLSEIDELSLDSQGRLLHFLQTTEALPHGSEKGKSANVRLVVATNQELERLCQSGQFREDLYHRLNQLNCQLPPLRLRREDILPLAEYFVDRYCQQLNKPVAHLTEACEELLLQYAWPGNVRQLKNAIFRAVSVLDDHRDITPELLKLPHYHQDFGYLDDEFDGTLEQAVKQFEANIIRRLYPSYTSTRKLAKKLGMSHTAIANKLKEYGISKPPITYTDS
ncbi:sigma 54-interacting transcriptional regulator [Paraferrimonas sedimenticola]|uniref:Transcriptional regulator n=1 Tax=Paraferrimonas sedimenticola TaxID=375674 RepID=A0AA37RRM7_9GAMM|nr:sigma 54-interacting transcriptional regulator [Paraferrimonas sedimenticola]GLP94830.1 transcriptional regulator [Paraferrimonas sedimenticola]